MSNRKQGSGGTILGYEFAICGFLKLISMIDQFGDLPCICAAFSSTVSQTNLTQRKQYVRWSWESALGSHLHGGAFLRESWCAAESRWQDWVGSGSCGWQLLTQVTVLYNSVLWSEKENELNRQHCLFLPERKYLKDLAMVFLLLMPQQSFSTYTNMAVSVNYTLE